MLVEFFSVLVPQFCGNFLFLFNVYQEVWNKIHTLPQYKISKRALPLDSKKKEQDTIAYNLKTLFVWHASSLLFFIGAYSYSAKPFRSHKRCYGGLLCLIFRLDFSLPLISVCSVTQYNPILFSFHKHSLTNLDLMELELNVIIVAWQSEKATLLSCTFSSCQDSVGHIFPYRLYLLGRRWTKFPLALSISFWPDYLCTCSLIRFVTISILSNGICL